MGLDRHGHACLVYDSDEQVQGAVATFLREGLELGQRIACVANDDEMRMALERVEDAERLTATGALVQLPLQAIYPEGRVGPALGQQLQVYAAATEQALADGYSGLRGAALVTDLVLDPASWQTHTRWEAFADRFMVENPFSALCCYDARRLPASVAKDLAAVHPVSCGTKVRPAFRIYADEHGRAIDGELDYFDCDDLDRLLVLTENGPDDVNLNLGALSFVDARAMLAIDKYRAQAEIAGKHAKVGASSRAVSRVADLLEIKL